MYYRYTVVLETKVSSSGNYVICCTDYWLFYDKWLSDSSVKLRKNVIILRQSDFSCMKKINVLESMQLTAEYQHFIIIFYSI